MRYRPGASQSRLVKENKGGLFDAQARPPTTRGTLMRNTANGTPQYWLDGVGPQFE